VLIPALGVSTVQGFGAVREELAARTRVCTYDRPGLGASEPSDRARTAAAMAEDLRAALVEERGPFVWAGASFGGLIAQILTAEHPEETAGVVLVDSLHPDLDREIPQIIGRAAAEQRERDLASTAEGLTYDDLLRSDEEARAAGDLGDVPLVVLKHTVSFEGEPLPALERLWTRLQRELAAASTRGRLVAVPDSHHRIASEHPDVVVDAVLEVSSTRR
jgi:pimeloyl-ACP methyl ester carboxylesterase